mmetsp:Transcript_100492/g.173562  ORF Transcript_100492/g.173562 Transcript_100492/m.173562 type:complete len:263 (-) Transcript_100492:133-921(-)
MARGQPTRFQRKPQPRVRLGQRLRRGHGLEGLRHGPVCHPIPHGVQWGLGDDGVRSMAGTEHADRHIHQRVNGREDVLQPRVHPPRPAPWAARQRPPDEAWQGAGARDGPNEALPRFEGVDDREAQQGVPAEEDVHAPRRPLMGIHWQELTKGVCQRPEGAHEPGPGGGLHLLQQAGVPLLDDGEGAQIEYQAQDWQVADADAVQIQFGDVVGLLDVLHHPHMEVEGEPSPVEEQLRPPGFGQCHRWSRRHAAAVHEHPAQE